MEENKLKVFIKKIVSFLICIAITLSLAAVSSSASEVDDVKGQIDKLESQIKDKANEISAIQKDKKDQQKIKNLYDEQMSLIQTQINLCNNTIRETNEKIAANDKEILKKESDMEVAIYDFKKRISAIYMNGNTVSGLELLLGAEDFSDFLALSQLTLNISRRDKKMMDDISDMIKEINRHKEENKKLLDSQNEIKSTLNSKYSEFDKLADAAQSAINSLSSDEQDAAADKKKLEADLKAKEKYLNQLLNPPQDTVYKGVFDGTFAWPVPGYLGITSVYGSRWGSFHKGIDLASSGIRGKAVIASASGVVSSTYSSCSHNYGKKSSCYSNGVRCGGGYGNYVVISHGQSNGTYYQSLYGHLGSVTVKPGQYVTQGQVIGYVGSTGYSTGWHLHFEIHKSTNGTSFSHTDPLPYVKKVK